MLTSFLVTSTADTTDEGTLRWAIEQANNNAGADTIEFDDSFDIAQTVVLNGTQLPKLTDTTGPTTISGPGKDLLTISGNDLSRVFWIDPQVDVSLSGMTISHGNSTGQFGGGVLLLQDGSLTVEGIRFTTNHADHGGAIYVDFGATLQVTSSTFTENTATENGGAIQTLGPSLSASNSIFTENSAKNGGAISNTGSGNLVLNTVTISENTASNGGGGVSHLALGSPSVATATIQNSSFTGNTAFQGGAIDTDTVLIVTNSNLAENSASIGGAIKNNGTTVVSNSILTGNDCDQSGGAIYNEASLTVDSSLFAENSSDSGGGIFSWGTLSVTDSTFDQNESTGSGGGIMIIGNATIDQALFLSNHALSGGGVGNYGQLTLEDSEFHSNTADSSGGAFVNSFQANVMRTKFYDNQSDQTGGAISNHQFYAILQMWDITIDSNTSKRGGGIDNSIGGKLEIERASLTNNSAQQGAGISNDFHSTLAVKDALIADNESEGGFFPSQGGGLANYSTATISNSTIANNTAASGAGIYHGYEYDPLGTLILQNVTIADNIATGQGGGLFLALDNQSAQLVNTIVGRNLRGTTPDDIHGTVDLDRSVHNLLGAGGAGGLKNGKSGNIVVADNSALGLGALADNGGYRSTIALLPSSPAVDAGTEDNTPLGLSSFDQRYVGNQYFSRVFGEAVDIGAFELQPGPFDANIEENTTVVTLDHEAGSFPLPLQFALTGGADQALFSINPQTGTIGFLAAPDFENPGDANGDNTYDVQVSITDGDDAVHQALRTIHVDNVNEGSTFTLGSDPAVYTLGGEGTLNPDALLQPDGLFTEYSQVSLQVDVINTRNEKDLLTIASQKGGPGQIQVKQGKLLFGGVQIGTVAGGDKQNPELLVQLNSSATTVAVNALLKRICFKTKAKNLPQSSRTLKVSITRENVGNLLATRTINVAGKQ